MIAVCAASSDCRAPAGKTCRCADLHCARLFRGESGAISANERRPQSSQGKLATKKRRQSFLESVFYVPSEKALASPPHTFATAGDSGMLESCPSRPPANREGIRLRRCPVGSNAQVPANWAFLQILAQSRICLELVEGPVSRGANFRFGGVGLRASRNEFVLNPNDGDRFWPSLYAMPHA